MSNIIYKAKRMETPRDKSIGAQMHIASQLLKKKVHRRIHEFNRNITLEQIVVLEMLKAHGSLKMSELARLTTKENAAITRMVDILERKDYVQRKPSPNDRRVWEIAIKPDGLIMLNKLMPIILDELKDATSCISKEEYEEAMRIVRKIIKFNQ